jgi:hypothetical protein
LRAAVAARRPGGAPKAAIEAPTNTIKTKSGRTIVYEE